MAENSRISWTDNTFNPWIGCTQVSEGCNNCYAENLMDKRYGRVRWGKGQPRSKTKTWNDPIRWNRKANEAGIRCKVFCASLADFLDEEVPKEWRDHLFRLIENCHSIDWLMLTKRIENAREMLPREWLRNPLPNVWLGTTMENQRRWDERIGVLSNLPAAIRWVSYEPSLGPLDMGKEKNIDWLIIGGESTQGSPAREFHLEWALDCIEQCRRIKVVPFVKQIGSNAFYKGLPYRTKDKAGADPSEWPKFARSQEFPMSQTIGAIS